MVHPHDPSTREVEAGGSEIQCHCLLHRKFQFSLGYLEMSPKMESAGAANCSEMPMLNPKSPYSEVEGGDRGLSEA